MGGKGSGGARLGGGQRPLSSAEAAMRGTNRRGRKHLNVPAVPLPAVPMPSDMPDDQQAVWQMLAPHALTARTLTPETSESFRDLCRVIVIRNGILAKIQEDGWTFVKVSVDGAGVEHSELKKHPLTPDLRGWEQRVEVGRARFRLAPFGKEFPSLEPADTDPFAEFDVN